MEALKDRSPGGCGARPAVEDAPSLLACGIRALSIDGDLQSSRGWLEAAYREAEQTGAATVMAEAVLGLSGLWSDEYRTAVASAHLRARLRHVLTLLDPTTALALRIRVRLAGETDYRTGEHARILAALDEARTSPDPVVRAEALRLAHHCLLGPDHSELRHALADELVGEAARGAGRADLLMGLLCQVVDLFLDGDPHAQRRLGELRAELERGEHLAIGYATSAIEVMLAIRAGRLDEAEQLAQDCLERGRKAGDANATAWYGAQLVAIRWYQDRLPELLPMLTDLVQGSELSTVDSSFTSTYALAAAMVGDQHLAMQAMATLRRPALADLPRSGSWLVAFNAWVEAAHRLGNEPAAQRAYQLLSPYASLPMMNSLAVTCFGSVHHALGVASLTTGDLDRAVTHLHEAVRRNLALGHWPAVLHSRMRLSEALNRRRAPGDEAEAREQRSAAAEVAGMLRAGPRRDGFPRPQPAGPATCTRHGRQWRIELGTRTVLVEHRVGLLHLAVLIANPGTEIAAVDLLAGVDAVGVAARGSGPLGQPVLDRTTIAGYRHRLAQLRDSIDERESRDDPDGAAKLRQERDWLLAELTANTRPGGRSRTFADNTERARLAAGRAIRRVMATIEQADPVIGAHLRATVHTGTRCWYRPI